MNVTYCAVRWNRNKKVYDGVVLAGIAMYFTGSSDPHRTHLRRSSRPSRHPYGRSHLD